jgi:hypothetical protein
VKTCKTCKFWTTEEGNNYPVNVMVPIDPDTWEPMEMPWEVRRCECPRIRFFERPVERDEAAVKLNSLSCC